MEVNNTFFHNLIKIAITESLKASLNNDIPVAAIVFKNNTIISKAHNCTYKYNDVSLHAEMLAIKKACKKIRTPRLDGFSIFTTLEPCTMCAGAIILAHIENIVILTPDLKSGACGSLLSIIPNKLLNHSPSITWLQPNQKYINLLKNFFKQRRNKK